MKNFFQIKNRNLQRAFCVLYPRLNFRNTHFIVITAAGPLEYVLPTFGHPDTETFVYSSLESSSGLVRLDDECVKQFPNPAVDSHLDIILDLKWGNFHT